MVALVRTINRAKWSAASGAGHFPADAITNCLSTRQNELSLWFSGDPGAIDEAVLAVAASKDHVGTIDVVVFSEMELRSLGFSIAATPGQTAAVALRGLHRDLVSLDFWSLGFLAEIIATKVLAGGVVRKTKSQIVQMISDGVANGQVDFEELADDIKKKVRK